MSCGHTLRNTLAPCGEGPRCKGEVWTPVFIGDSCAACHRPMNRAQHRVLHEAEQTLLMADYRAASKRGDEQEMRRLTKRMHDLTKGLREKNFAVSLTRENDVGTVMWPGKGQENDGATGHDGHGLGPG
ncbi:hypothetical protein C8035_v000947 [Colletotrichum spinosum]|uniref:Uncharacterized protein n=1 Tax=Colletotrichum spinosum TaxID=1347390 RepID=A0A4V3HRI4_9PEZI|nr:hypothetical protein C8035_v000947 [Colletotrichum spinosum]